MNRLLESRWGPWVASAVIALLVTAGTSVIMGQVDARYLPRKTFDDWAEEQAKDRESTKQEREALKESLKQTREALSAFSTDIRWLREAAGRHEP